jgi:hypothetical protein
MDWSRQHPWIAGCYFATWMSVFVYILPLLIKTSADLEFRAVLALVTWPPTVLLFGWSVKYRVGLRPDAEDHPRPTRLAPWRWTSDRSLSAFWWLGVAGVLVTLIHWGDRSRPLGAVIGSCSSLWIVVTTWQERKRRRTQS